MRDRFDGALRRVAQEWVGLLAHSRGHRSGREPVATVGAGSLGWRTSPRDSVPAGSGGGGYRI